MLLAHMGFHTPNTNPFLPMRPSPLSERSANTAPRPFIFGMASQDKMEKKTPVPQRAHKPNPVVQTRDKATQRRRDMFFRRVQRGRDDRNWDARGEQIQRLDYLSDHKRWEAEKAREAPPPEDEYVDEEFFEEAMSSNAPSYISQPQPEQEVEEVDYILSQEEQELQEMIASLEEDQMDATSQHYGSDEDDYDQIFMECASTADTENQQHQPQQANTIFEVADDMDMTDG